MAAVSTHAPASENELAALLREHGHRVTPQRLVLHRVLLDLGRHATADEILRASDDRLPGVALPTVYATLDLLADLGVVRRFPGADGTALYDPRTDAHQHLVCRTCGAVADVEATVDDEPVRRRARSKGFRPDRVEVLAYGRCRSCTARERS